MSDFKPVPRIHKFIYESFSYTLYLDCTVDIPLPANRDLLKYNPSYDASLAEAAKVYDHDPNAPSSLPRTLTEAFKVEIMKDIDIPYDAKDPEAFRKSLRNRMAPSYTLRARVNTVNNDPDTGGYDTNTINKSEEIKID